MSEKKPTGITAIIILSIIIGALLFLGGVTGLALGNIGAIFTLVISSFMFVSVYGLLNKTQLGHRIALAVYSISIPYTLVSIFRNGDIKQLVAIAIASLIIWYLLKPEVKNLFTK